MSKNIQENIVTDILTSNQIISPTPKDFYISKPVKDLGKFLSELNAKTTQIEKSNI